MFRLVIKAILLLLALFIAGFAVFLLFRGAPFSSIPIVENNIPLPDPITTYEQPYLPAIFPILGSILVFWGVWIKKLILAWLGAGLLMVYAGLFLFSWGGVFFIPGIILLLLLLVYQILHGQNFLLNKNGSKHKLVG